MLFQIETIAEFGRSDELEQPRITGFLPLAKRGGNVDVASGRSNGSLKYTWSFEWPTRDQWDAGQRYGYCWVPG